MLPPVPKNTQRKFHARSIRESPSGLRWQREAAPSSISGIAMQARPQRLLHHEGGSANGRHGGTVCTDVDPRPQSSTRRSV